MRCVRNSRVAVALHIHDDDLWMYELYAAGVLQDCFNTNPTTGRK